MPLAERLAQIEALCEELLVGVRAIRSLDAFIIEASPPTCPAGLVIDTDRFRVVWAGRDCVLGPTLPFYLIRYLAKNQGRYIPHQELLHRVWHVPSRSPQAIRSVVADLRLRLRQAGMSDLADSIDGRHAGRYGLLLPA